MQTLYDWLLYNTEDAGNYYTILNTKRDKAGSIDVMARSSDFNVVHLFIDELKNAGLPDGTLEKASGTKYVFADEQQVITYLTEGKPPESGQSDEAAGIRVLITEPDAEAGDVTFPPDHQA